LELPPGEPKRKLVVDHKESDAPNVLAIVNDRYRRPWARIWLSARCSLRPLAGKIRGVARIQSLLGWIVEPWRWLERQRGLEEWIAMFRADTVPPRRITDPLPGPEE